MHTENKTDNRAFRLPLIMDPLASVDHQKALDCATGADQAAVLMRWIHLIYNVCTVDAAVIDWLSVYVVGHEIISTRNGR